MQFRCPNCREMINPVFQDIVTHHNEEGYVYFTHRDCNDTAKKPVPVSNLNDELL